MALVCYKQQTESPCPMGDAATESYELHKHYIENEYLHVQPEE